MQKWSRTVLFALIVLCNALWARADSVILAPVLTVNVGDTFLVPISITNATDLTSWQFDLAFNPTIVKVSQVIEGPLMSSFGQTLFGPGAIDNDTGLISLVTDSFVDLPPDPSGSGVLAFLEFTAVAPGVSALTFSNPFVNDLDGVFGVTDGQITVGETSQVPEPSSLTSLFSGSLVLGLLLRRKKLNRSVCSRYA
jgi:hypothetical protein